MKVSDMMNQSSFKRPINFRPGDDRFIGGGFLAPFLLGGITGGLLAPAFYNNRPYYHILENYYIKVRAWDELAAFFKRPNVTFIPSPAVPAP